MTQTRSFLLIAWLVLAFFLWDSWQKDYAAPPAPASSAAGDPVPAAAGTVPSVADVPTSAAAAPRPTRWR